MFLPWNIFFLRFCVYISYLTCLCFILKNKLFFKSLFYLTLYYISVPYALVTLEWKFSTSWKTLLLLRKGSHRNCQRYSPAGASIGGSFKRHRIRVLSPPSLCCRSGRAWNSYMWKLTGQLPFPSFLHSSAARMKPRECTPLVRRRKWVPF